MNRIIILSALPFLFFLSIYGQNQGNVKTARNFDEKRTKEILKHEGVPESEFSVMIEKMRIRTEWIYQAETGNNNPINSTKSVLPPQLHNASCPNAGFEMVDFSNWIGGWYLNSNFTPWGNNPPPWNGATSWNQFSTAGVNASLLMAGAQQTLITTPTGTLNPGPGWDPNAINSSNKSVIPILNPNGSGVSVRLGNGDSGGEVARLKYVMAVSPGNTQFTYSYAIVLNDGGHPLDQSPFFRIITRDSSLHQLVTGPCNSYNITGDAATLAADTSFKTSKITASDGTAIHYKKWTTVSVDLSNQIGDTVSVEFIAADCSQGGHFGYAYIDCSCGVLQGTVNGFCTGNTQVALVAASGFVSYQWQGPNSTTNIAGATNDTLIVNNPALNDVYTVVMVSAAGCTTTVQTTVQQSQLEAAFSQSPSCPDGHTGSASVIPSGGVLAGYNYIWSSGQGGTGTIYSTTQSVSGLPTDTTWLHLTSGSCPVKDTFVVIDPLQPIPAITPAVYCNTSNTLIAGPSTGTNYQWYNNSNNPVTINGNDDSLLISPVTSGLTWSLGYNDTTTGCRDSVRYPLTQLFGANAFANNACTGAPNGSVSFGLTSGYSPYTYNVTGPASFTNSITTNSTSYIINNLSPGTYTTLVSIAQCYDSLTFVIGINPVPVTGQTKNFCSSSYPLTIVAPNSAGQNNYQWYDNTGALIAGATNDSLVINTPLNGNIYSAGFTDANGCKDSLRVTLNQPTFTVTSIPSPSCYGASTGNTTLTASTGFGPYTYHITGPGSFNTTNTFTSATYIASNLAPGTYTAVITTPSGCYDSITTVIGNGTLGITSKHDSICPGDTKTITSSVSGATHQWYSAGGIITGATAQSYTASPAVLGVYIDTVKTALGCESVFKDSITEINFSSAVTSKTNNPCYQDSVASVSVSSTGGISAYTFNWSGPGGFTGTGSAQTNLNSGTYTIVTHSGNCKDSLTVTITEPSLPADTLTITTTFCDLDTSATLYAPPGFTNYQWYFNGVSLTGETDSAIFILNPASTFSHYSVTYIIPPCERKTTVVFQSLPGALFTPELTTNVFTPNGDGKNDFFNPFFNPLVSQQYIAYASENYSIKIFDRWGLMVFESDNYAAQWNGKTKSGKECGDGTYYWLATYSAKCGKGVTTTKTGFVQLQR